MKFVYLLNYLLILEPSEKGIIGENVTWNEDLGEWQLKCVAYTGNNMRKQKDSDIDKNKVDFVTLNFCLAQII